jgi:DNA transposition AAA+ family ATPase
MMITEELKSKIVAALQGRRGMFDGSDAKFATSLDINPAQYSRIMKGDTEKVLSEDNWIILARKVGVDMQGRRSWVTASTPVYRFITAQLEMCQKQSLSAILCDLSDIGKTYTARRYAETHRNAVYVDCSQVKTRTRLVRYIAQSFGLQATGWYPDVYGDLVSYLKTAKTPLVILDEAGDIDYEAFKEIKALWNATELACGWYMMGADGLQEKIRRGINCRTVGYQEIFSRFGKRYGKVIPAGKDEGDRLLQASAAMIIKANAEAGVDVNRLLRATMGEDGAPSLRRIYKELSKIED